MQVNSKNIFILWFRTFRDISFNSYLICHSNGNFSILMERYQSYWSKFLTFPDNAFSKEKPIINSLYSGLDSRALFVRELKFRPNRIIEEGGGF